MYQIQTLNKISPLGLEKFDRAKYVWGDEIQNPQPACGVFISVVES